MPTGTIKKYFADKGFGFIGADDGSADIFAHARQYIGGDANTVQDGMKVEYESEWDDRKGKPKAKTWSTIGGGGGAGGGGAPMQQQPQYGGAPMGGAPMGGNYGAMPAQRGPDPRFQPYGGGAPMGGCGGPQPGYGGPPQQQQAYGGAPQGGPILPPGWEQAPDPSSGKPYFFNRATGETSWDPPQAPAPQYQAPAPAPAPAPVPQQPTNQLPPGWEQAPDPSSGKNYFFNRATGETSWEPPR